MRTVVFSGPTLPGEEAREHLDADHRGPAAQGDVYRAALDRPHAIVIVDGYFERVPSVWHKEILWAMAQGIHVLGAASMGALRAAELAPYGMRGVGAIFSAYRRGMLEDDDEVAVAHGPPETGHRPTSEAMVNIRWTLDRAQADQVVQAETAQALGAIAKALFYPERSYPRAIGLAREAGLPGDELDRLVAWLPDGRVDRKRADALAALRVVRDGGVPQARLEVPWTMEWTLYWQGLVDEVAVTGTEPAGEDGITAQLVLDEQRLEPRVDRRPALDEARSRARSKQHTLTAHAMANPGLEEADETRETLLRWYFDRVELDVPPDPDGYARAAGFAGEPALLVALARERCHQRLVES